MTTLPVRYFGKEGFLEMNSRRQITNAERQSTRGRPAIAGPRLRADTDIDPIAQRHPAMYRRIGDGLQRETASSPASKLCAVEKLPPQRQPPPRKAGPQMLRTPYPMRH